MNNKSIQIGKEDAGKRLDKFLAEKIPEFSRSFLQKEIKEGMVTVNGEKTSAHFFLREGDVATVGKLEEPVLVLEPNKKLKVKIVFEDENYLVVLKPAGMVVHPAEGHGEQDTLANWLIAYLPEIKNIGPDPLRPGIVHRLDADASGLLVIAKTKEMYENLRKQFDGGKIFKEYTVLVKGVVGEEDGTISSPLGRAKHGFKMVPREGGREAITHFKVLQKFKKYTLLSVETETGRMHQIRAHFASLGHGILGEKIYCKRKDKFQRLFLAATRLGFEDLKGEWREFETGLDEELKKILEEIK